ncbi:hypothetical protein ACF08N_12020 [Streptomyces sp. NPDC015127]|uniref:hypothetical protein n=1 Tax=Streptomyces sp. NPDC015127 TaxID=3364939 RepID=UPI0036F6FE8D
MIETIPWEKLAGDPEEQLRLLEEREVELQQELFKVRQEVKLMRQLLKARHTFEEWCRSGIPEQRKSPDDHHADADSGSTSSFQAPTRKVRILALLGQDPQRHWKVSDVASALDEVAKVKSVRVAMDELAKAGSLAKLPNAFYQYVTKHQP